MYRAFRKYGLENFSFEILEQCKIDKLSEKEIFYIEKYNSYKNGYNQTLGGEGYKRRNILDEDIINAYLDLKTINAVAKKHNITTEYIVKVLTKNNIPITTFQEHAKEKGNKILRCDLNGNVLEEYICLNDAGKWLLENNLTNAKTARNAGMPIKMNIIKSLPYKGFIWKSDFYSNIDKEYLENMKKVKKLYNEKNRNNYSKKSNCKNCGCLISSNHNYCLNCFSNLRLTQVIKNREENLGISRDILKEKIRTTSFLQIGKEYNVTDNAIRKWCKAYNLPFKSSEIKKYTDEEWINI